MEPVLTLKNLFSVSEVQIINAGLRRLDEKKMIMAALEQVDGFEEQKQSIIKKMKSA
jgi:hypothetical protein